MLEIRVGGKDCDFSNISEAVNAVPYAVEAVIYIGEGVYREKIFSDKKNIAFIGEGPDKTILEYDDGALNMMEDGTKRGTFRTYTAFFGGEKTVVKNMTIRNTAGSGRKVGQALAVYADASVCYFENVRLLGHQDTLFMSPLPMAEREKKGFMGPRVLTERLLTRQYYKNCYISGDVDFIFGGADAVFDDCDIVVNDRYKDGSLTLKDGERAINGYVTAGCGLKSGIGMIFRRCSIKGEESCAKGSVFLGRPWRDEARAVFLDCIMDDTIAQERFSGWGSIEKAYPDTFYGEWRTVDGAGNSIDLSMKNPWVRVIDNEMYSEINKQAEDIINIVEMESRT